jgi:aspartate/methionine/tyrosine aminotransferase
MHVKIHKLFEVLLQTTGAQPEAALGLSMAEPPRLGEFLSGLDPNLGLDWSGQSFQGLPALRQGVIERMGLGGRCSADDVLITAGTAEANFLAITQLLQQGDDIVVDTPGWPQPLVLTEAIGANLRHLTRREERGWAFEMAELEALVSERTRLIFLCNPNNPTGHVLSEAELLEVVRIADRVGAFVLVDEVYAGLEWHGPRAPSIAGLYERGISTGSVSKALGLQGLRAGWLVTPNRTVLMDAVILRENTSEIMNVMGEVIAEIALRPERYAHAIRKARADGLHNLGVLDAFIQARPELSWVRPQAGLVGLVHFDRSISSDELAQRALEAPFRTFVIPGSAYGCPQHVRLGVGGGATARLELGLERFGALLDSLT